MTELIAVVDAKENASDAFGKAIENLIASAEAVGFNKGYNKGYNEARRALENSLIKGLSTIINEDGKKK